MKLVLSIVILLFISAEYTNAQNDSIAKPRRGYIGITLGPSYPMRIDNENSFAGEGLKGRRGVSLNIIDFGLLYFCMSFGNDKPSNISAE